MKNVEEEIMAIRDDVEHIKQDIDSINRVQVLASSGVILQDIRSTVGRSKIMIAALFLTKSWISAGELAEKLEIDQSNLSKFLNPLYDSGLLYRERRGSKIYYRRATRLDLIRFEQVDEFRQVYESWQEAGGGINK